MIGPVARLRTLRARLRYTGPTVDGVRAPRAIAMTGVGLAALAGMFQLVSSNVLAVNFTTTDHTFQVYSNYIQGVSAGGFLSQNKAATAAGQQGVAELGIKTAQLDGLCAIAHESLVGVGDVSLIIKAGSPVRGSFDPSQSTFLDGDDEPVGLNADGSLADTTDTISATDLFLNTNDLSGYGNQISGLDLGTNAPDTAQELSTGAWPTNQLQPVDGAFGLTAQHLNVGYLDGASYGINLAGQISLPSLKIRVVAGSSDQTACPNSAS
jgi:hypothetical protein